MFAAAAIVAQTAFQSLILCARYLATKALLISLLAIFLPWVLKAFFLWAFDFIIIYTVDILHFIWDQIPGLLASVGVNAGNTSINLSSVGGYLAEKTGLIDYCSIVFSGWSIYWVIAVLAKLPIKVA